MSGLRGHVIRFRAQRRQHNVGPLFDSGYRGFDGGGVGVCFHSPAPSAYPSPQFRPRVEPALGEAIDEVGRRAQQEREKRKNDALRGVYEQTGIIGRHREYVAKSDLRLMGANHTVQEGIVDGWKRAIARAENALLDYVRAASENGANSSELDAARHLLY